MNVSPLRVMIFIDGAYLYYGLRVEKGEDRLVVDRIEFVQAVLRVLSQERPVPGWCLPKRVVEKPVEFVTMPVNYQASSQEKVQKQINYFLGLEKIGYEVVRCLVDFEGLPISGYDKIRPRFRPQSPDIDKMLTDLALQKADQYDIAVVLSGSTGLIPLYQRLHEQGKYVTVIAFRGNCSEAVKRCSEVDEVQFIENLPFVVRSAVLHGRIGRSQQEAAG